MRPLILLLALSLAQWCYAAESTVTVPWESFDNLYRGQIEQQFLPIEEEPNPLVSLEQIFYDLEIDGELAIGTVSVAGSVLVGYPDPVRLFGQSIAVTEILESQNAVLIASDGAYGLYPQEPGMFLLIFKVSIPIMDFELHPRLELDVPEAVRNELTIKTPGDLKLLDSDNLHPIDGRYFFAPTRLLTVSFEHVTRGIDAAAGDEDRLTKVDTPEAVLDSITFYVSFTEDGSMLTAMKLELPPTDSNRLLLEPVEGAEIWSLKVNGEARSLFLSPEGQWVIPLDPGVHSRVELAYITRTERLGLQGRLDFEIPPTGLTAREVNLMVGLPRRMQMLAMDSDLQPASGQGWPRFDSFDGRPHYFSRPFYRGHGFRASIIYQEPANPMVAKHDG